MIIETIYEQAQNNPSGKSLLFPKNDSPSDWWTWKQTLFSILSKGKEITPGLDWNGRVVLICTPDPEDQALYFLSVLAYGGIPSIISFPSVKQDAHTFSSMLLPVLENSASEFAIVHANFIPHLKDLDLKLIAVTPWQRDSGEAVSNFPTSRISSSFLQFSSGTTGARKGVLISGKMFEAHTKSLSKALKLSPSDVVLSWLPMYHDMGLVGCFLNSIACGVPSIHQSPFDWLADVGNFFSLASQQRATLCWLPNFAYEIFASRRSSFKNLEPVGLRAIINCSEPIKAISHKRFQRAFEDIGITENCIHSSYAMAENTFVVSQTSLDKPARNIPAIRDIFTKEHKIELADSSHPQSEIVEFVSSGRVVSGTQVQIGEGLKDGRVGEICIKGDFCFDGYVCESGKNKQSLTEDGWYKTGDLGFILDEELYVTGRSKDLIIVRGHNVYPTDIEEMVAGIPGVKSGRCVCFGIYDDSGGTEQVIVMFETDQKGEANQIAAVDRFRGAVRDQVGILLKDVVACELGQLKKSTSGKLSRSKNREWYLKEYRQVQAQKNSLRDVADVVSECDPALDRDRMVIVPVGEKGVVVIAEIRQVDAGGLQDPLALVKRIREKVLNRLRKFVSKVIFVEENTLPRQPDGMLDEELCADYYTDNKLKLFIGTRYGFSLNERYSLDSKAFTQSVAFSVFLWPAWAVFFGSIRLFSRSMGQLLRSLAPPTNISHWAYVHSRSKRDREKFLAMASKLRRLGFLKAETGTQGVIESNNVRPITVVRRPGSADVVFVFHGLNNETEIIHWHKRKRNPLSDLRLDVRNMVHLHDNRYSGFGTGISPEVSSWMGLLCYLKGLCDIISCRNIYCLGFSNGCAAAISSGHFLKAKQVLAFSPNRTRHGLLRPIYDNIEELSVSNGVTKYSICFAKDDPTCRRAIDLFERASLPDVRLLPQPSGGHLFWTVNETDSGLISPPEFVTENMTRQDHIHDVRVSDVVEELLEMLFEMSIDFGESLNSETNLLTSLESIALVELLNKIEIKFGRTIRLGEIAPEHLTSVRALASFVLG
ncbi:MAG: hypothetical protein A2341_02300 [Deltaproteobacteria bacterium RIFOXYB12_FULL_58_9]|nr:MAG: hypothetical protein A2341_02300 [Deltaproteobacteria bacterium RIFOXYB12_FULL_58_9]